MVAMIVNLAFLMTFYKMISLWILFVSVLSRLGHQTVPDATWQRDQRAAAGVCLLSSAQQEPFLSHTAIQLPSIEAQCRGYDGVDSGQRKERRHLMSADVVSLRLTADAPAAHELFSKSGPKIQTKDGLSQTLYCLFQSSPRDWALI